MKTYLIEMPDDWKPGKCAFCYGVSEGYIASKNDCFGCPLSTAKEAKPIYNMGKPENLKLYSVEIDK